MPLVTPADRRWKVGVYVARGPAGKGSHGNMRVSSSSPTKKHRVHRRVREERSERAWRAAPSAVLDPAPSAVVRQLSISAALRQGVGGAQSRPPSAANASPGAAYVPTTAPRPQRRAGETANHGILRHRYTTTNETADGHTASSRMPRFFDSYVWVKRKARIGSTPLSTTLSAPRPSFYLYLGGFSLRAFDVNL